MKIKNERDFWSGLMFLVAGAAFAWGATSYAFGSSAQPGPGYFPFGLGLLLALLGAIELFKSLTFESEGGGAVGAVAWRPLVVVVGAVALFGWALPRLGLLVALPGVVLVASLAADGFRWRDALVSALVLTAASWAVFVAGLKLVIPLWPAFVR